MPRDDRSAVHQRLIVRRHDQVEPGLDLPSDMAPATTVPDRERALGCSRCATPTWW
jgi:hypothetical protein